MMISSKGRYALRVMIDLAQNNTGEPISLKDISERQDASTKYLELIVAQLSKGGLIDSTRGKKGGYKLIREPKDYTIGSILKQVENNLAPVNCIEGGVIKCDRDKANVCITLPMWKKLDDIIDEYLESVTLEDLLEGRIS